MSKPRRLAIATVWLGLASAAGFGVTPAAAQVPTQWANWLDTLAANGYGVTQGSVVVNSGSYCTQTVIPVFGSCFLNDPTDPYLSPLMPVGNGYVDPYFGGVSSQTQPDGSIAGQDWRLDTTEAELVIVNLPPQAAYFSYQSYVFTRLSSFYKKGTKQPSPDPSRGMLFASFTNSTNNVAIQNQSGLGFGAGTVAFITTGNAAIATDMINQWVAAGGDPTQIFVEQMGPNLGFGLDQDSDDFLTLLRYLDPMDPVASGNWTNNAANNVFVYRIDEPPTLGLTPYPAQTLLTRSLNVDETPYASDISELSGLMQNWLATQEKKKTLSVKAASTSETVTPQGVVTKGSDGPFCIKNGTYCIADEQDTAAYRTMSVGSVPSNRLFVIDGVDHTVTNDATLVSLTLIDNTNNTGVLGVAQVNAAAAGFTSGTLTGSAVNALQTLGLWGLASPQLQNDAPNLYVQIFTRGCTTQVYCNQPFTTVVPQAVLPYSHGIGVMERAYVLPGYTNGANPDFLVLPNAIY